MNLHKLLGRRFAFTNYNSNRILPLLMRISPFVIPCKDSCESKSRKPWSTWNNRRSVSSATRDCSISLPLASNRIRREWVTFVRWSTTWINSVCSELRCTITQQPKKRRYKSHRGVRKDRLSVQWPNYFWWERTNESRSFLRSWKWPHSQRSVWKTVFL